MSFTRIYKKIKIFIQKLQKWFLRDLNNVVQDEWRSNGHGSIAHQLLTALEQWKISRHRSLWVAVGICTVSKWTAPVQGHTNIKCIT